MFSYYGSKSKVVDYYPAPKHNLVIEPFAGSARYALKYFDRDVILMDKNPLVVQIWYYLQQCSIQDIKRLPVLKRGTVISREMFTCDGEYALMRFLIVQAAFSGNNTVTKFGEMRFENNRGRIIANLHKIRHWKIMCGDYNELENIVATWFIDPPYVVGGHKYTFSSKRIDFNALSGWCQTRLGQVIVCESAGAEWLPFVPLKKMNGIVGDSKMEGIWTNEPTQYNNVQLGLF